MDNFTINHKMLNGFWKNAKEVDLKRLILFLSKEGKFLSENIYFVTFLWKNCELTLPKNAKVPSWKLLVMKQVQYVRERANNYNILA